MCNVMEDSKCILLEFINEGNSIAVGFQNWIINSLTDQELIAAVEKKETIAIKWPNCDIEPASKMQKKVEACQWKKCIAIILAWGSKYTHITVKTNRL